MKDQKVPPTDTTLSKRLRRGDTVYIKYEYDRYYVPGKIKREANLPRKTP